MVPQCSVQHRKGFVSGRHDVLAESTARSLRVLPPATSYDRKPEGSHKLLVTPIEGSIFDSHMSRFSLTGDLSNDFPAGRAGVITSCWQTAAGGWENRRNASKE